MSTFPSPASGQLPFSGTVTDLPLPVALERLFRARSTGLLELEARPGHHVVFVRDGYPVAVELPGSFELLGKVLVEMKILDEQTYQSTLSAPPPEGQRYGELLRSRGLVTEDQLRQALKAQVRRKLHRLFFLSEASIVFKPGEHQEGLQRNESLRIHPWRANYHGVRSAWNADRLRQALAPLGGRPMSTTLSTEELARFGLGVEDGKAANLLRTQLLTVDALSSACGLPVQPVSALCYALYVAAALDDGEPAAARGAPTSMDGATGPTAMDATSAARPTPAAMAAVAPADAPQTDAERAIAERVARLESEDLFATLGLQRTATPEQIKNAYLDAARRYHPDRLITQGLARVGADVAKLFRRIGEAQATLLDDQKRAEYLRQLESPTSKEDAAAHQQVVTILQAEMAFTRGQHLLKKNDLPAALRDFEAALAAQPTEGEHIVYAAWTRHCTGQMGLAEAKAEISRGLKAAPRCASGHYFLGMLYKEEDAFESAVASFRRAINLDARQFEAEQELRIIETRRSRQTEKRGLFDRFLKPKS